MKLDAENGFVQKWDRKLKKSLGGALRQLRPTGGGTHGHPILGQTQVDSQWRNWVSSGYKNRMGRWH